MEAVAGKSMKRGLKHCGVPQCNTYKSKSVSMHQIPNKVLESRSELIKWKVALKMGKSFPKNFKICSKHFQEKYLLTPLHPAKKLFKVHLVDGAFPTENLPKSSINTKRSIDTSRSSRLLKRSATNSEWTCNNVVLKEPTELSNINRQSEIAFEYVEIKQEPNNSITSDEPMSSNSVINFLEPLTEIKIESEENSSQPNFLEPLTEIKIESEENSSQPSPIALCSPSQNSCKMVDQTCQTGELYDQHATEGYKDQLIAKLKRENEQLKERLLAKPSMHNQFCKLSIGSLKAKNKKVNFLTGFPNFNTMEIIYKDVANSMPSTLRWKISKFDVFLMTLIKLEMDLSLHFLSILMDVTTTTVTRLFYETFVVLYNRLNGYIAWPDDTQNRLNTPTCYKQIFGEGRFIIVDFFEILFEQISSKNNLESTSIRNKGTTVLGREFQISKPKSEWRTMRYLISFSTAGTIIYLSKPFDTAHSNEYIAKQSGFLDKIDLNHIILANRELLSGDKAKPKDLVPMVKNVDGELAEIKFEETAEFTNIREDIAKKIRFAKGQILLQTNRSPVLAIVNEYGEKIYSEFVIKLACSVVNIMVLNTDVEVVEQQKEPEVTNNKDK